MQLHAKSQEKLRFKDKNIEKLFLSKGFVVLEIFDKQDLKKLRLLYKENLEKFKIKPGENHSSCDTLNFDFIKNINSEIGKIIIPRLDKIFSSYDYLLSSYLTKEPGKKNTTNYHQDPTMIEGSTNISAGLWTPLQNTDKNNGCLRMVEGSHRLKDVLSITPSFPTIFRKFPEKLKYYDQDVPLLEGQGVLFDNKLIHGAHANQSKNKRIAVVTALKSKGAQWVYYHKENDEKKVGKYLMDNKLYAEHQHGKKPKGKLIESFDYTFPELSYVEFIKFMFFNNPIQTMKNLLK